GARLRFSATAYCKGTTTASGTAVRTGIAAADPELLPVGSVIQVESLTTRYNGIYTIMDTGPEVQGRELDIYIRSCHEALAFGRRGNDVHGAATGWEPAGHVAGVDSVDDSHPRAADERRRGTGARDARACRPHRHARGRDARNVHGLGAPELKSTRWTSFSSR